MTMTVSGKRTKKHAREKPPPSKRALALQAALNTGKINGHQLGLAVYAFDVDAMALMPEVEILFDDPIDWVLNLAPWGAMAYSYAAYEASNTALERELQQMRLSRAFLDVMGNAVAAVGLAIQCNPAPIHLVIGAEKRMISAFERNGYTAPLMQMIFSLLDSAFKTVSDAKLSGRHCVDCVRVARDVVNGAGHDVVFFDCPVMGAIRKRLVDWAVGSVR